MLLGLIMWLLLYLNALCSYRLARGVRKTVIQLSMIFCAAALFVLQINVMNHLAPLDSRSNHFFVFVLVECVGGLAIMFRTLLIERAKKKTTF